MQVVESGDFKFTLDEDHFTVMDIKGGVEMYIPKKDFAKALVGMGIVKIAIAQWNRKE